MKKTMSFFIIGLIIGGLLTGYFLFRLSPGIILKENQSKYGFEESIEKLELAIEESGWKMPAKHDLQATLLKHGKSKVNNVIVLEICNPDLAEKILLTDDERIVSNMMPCRIAVYEKNDGKVYFSRMNAELLSKPMGKVTRVEMKRAARDTEKILEVLK